MVKRFFPLALSSPLLGVHSDVGGSGKKEAERIDIARTSSGERSQDAERRQERQFPGGGWLTIEASCLLNRFPVPTSKSI